MDRKLKMQELLNTWLVPIFLQINDVSHQHAGHSLEARAGGTHYNAIIVSDKFQNKSMVQRHRLVYQILEEEMKQGVHALSLKTYTAQEYLEIPTKAS